MEKNVGMSTSVAMGSYWQQLKAGIIVVSSSKSKGCLETSLLDISVTSVEAIAFCAGDSVILKSIAYCKFDQSIIFKSHFVLK